MTIDDLLCYCVDCETYTQHNPIPLNPRPPLPFNAECCECSLVIELDTVDPDEKE